MWLESKAYCRCKAVLTREDFSRWMKSSLKELGVWFGTTAFQVNGN